MSDWWTTPNRGEPVDRRAAGTIAPGLLFHKWHHFDPPGEDGKRFQVKSTRVPWLRSVAAAVDAATARHGAGWQRDYLAALEALGVRTLRAVTVTRLAAGLATNPALENGLHLHPLHGFPILPGSAVKGLVHSVAERELIGDERFAGGEFLSDPERIDAFLTEAEPIWRIFGGLSLEPMAPTPKADPPAVPAEALARIRADEDLPQAVRERAIRLLTEARIARARFYDAFPAMDPPPRGLLEPDILNPHYPDYYDSGNRWQAAARPAEGGKSRKPNAQRHSSGGPSAVHPPSDDQDPRPVYFLTVRAGVEFVFPWRYVEVPEPDGASAADPEPDVERIERWLQTGLTDWGLGGKTAAGYGYFGMGDDPVPAVEGAGSSAPVRATPSPDPPATALWKGVTVRYQANRREILIDHEGRCARAHGQEPAAGLPERLQTRLFSKPRKILCNARVSWQPEGYYRIDELVE